MKIRRCFPKVLAVLAGLPCLYPSAPPWRGAVMLRRAPPPMTDALAERLKHLTLDDAIDIALHRNPQILNQLQEIQRLQGTFVQVRAAALPHVIATGTFSAEDSTLLGGVGASSVGTTTAATGLTTGGLTGTTGVTGTTGTTGGATAPIPLRTWAWPR